jgi:peptidoglycan/LPS O-acetylase OafA/YrhL
VRALGYEVPVLDATWSLSVEECFYFTWPFLLSIVLMATPRYRRRMAILAALVVVAIAWRIGLYVGGAKWFRVYYPPDANAYALLMGCLLAGWCRQPRGLDRRWLMPVGLVVVLGVTTLPWSLFGFGWTVTGMVVAAAGGMLLVLDGWRPESRLAWRPLARLGRISYGVYLWQMATIALPPCDDLPDPWRGITAAVLAICAAMLSYRYVEAPFLRLKRRYRAIPTASTTSAVANPV